MINIYEENSVSKAWRKTLVELFNSNNDTDNLKYFKDSPTLILINDPKEIDSDELFPMDKNDLEIINEYIYTGLNENLVVHEWTKIYYHRIFDNPNSQIEFMIKKLKEEIPTGEAQISMWDKEIDQEAVISPCTQILWARIKFGKLEWHTHAHSSDAYKKLFMNLSEFISLQHYVAGRLNVEVGPYYHFIDSCHLHFKDLTKIKLLIQELAIELNFHQ